MAAPARSLVNSGGFHVPLHPSIRIPRNTQVRSRTDYARNRLRRRSARSTLTAFERSLLPRDRFDDSSGNDGNAEGRVGSVFPLEAESRLLFRANWQASDDWAVHLDGKMRNLLIIPFGFLANENAGPPFIVNYMHAGVFDGWRVAAARRVAFRTSLIEAGGAILSRGYQCSMMWTMLDVDAQHRDRNDPPFSYKYASTVFNPHVKVVSTPFSTPPHNDGTELEQRRLREAWVNRQMDMLSEQTGLVNDVDEAAALKGRGDYSNNSWIFLNGFIIVFLRSGRCEPDDEILSALLRRSKSFYSPPRHLDHPSLCFWECLAEAESRAGRRVGEKRKSGRNHKRRALELRRQAGGDAYAVTFADLDGFAERLGLNISIVDLERNTLYTSGDFSPRHSAPDHVLLCLVQNHYVLPRSFTSCVLMRATCAVCKRCFENEELLQEHVEGNDCLNCKKCGAVFSTRKLKSQHRQHCNAHKREVWMTAPDKECYAADDILWGVADFESLSGEQRVYAGGAMVEGDTQPTMWYGRDVFGDFKGWLDQIVEARAADVYEALLVKFDEKCLEILLKPDPVRALRRLQHTLREALAKDDVCPICQQAVLPQDFLQHSPLDVGRDSWADTCTAKYWAQARVQSELRRNAMGTCPPICIYAHNGGGYDWLLFYNYLLTNGFNSECTLLMRSGRILEMKYRECISLKDTVRMGLMGSLESLAKSYNSPVLKGEFPYTFVDDWDKIDGVFTSEQVDRFHFSRGDKVGNVKFKRPLSEEEHSAYFAEPHRQGRFDVRYETLLYLKSDIEALLNVCRSYWDGWMSMDPPPRTHPTCYITSSQLAFDYFLSQFMEPESLARLTTAETDLLRAATFGGRVEPFRRYVERDPKPDGVDDADWGGFIRYYDVNSEYPFIMQQHRALPVGLPTWYVDRLDAALIDLQQDDITALGHGLIPLSSTDLWSKWMSLTQDWCGFVCADIEAPQDLHLPVLPERRRMPSSPAEKTMFTLWSKDRHTYYSYELWLALSKGYRVTRVYWLAEFEAGHPFHDFIETMKAQKYDADGKDPQGDQIWIEDENGERIKKPKNPAKRAASKLAMNSSFGKTLQRASGEEYFVGTAERLAEIMEIGEDTADVKVYPLFQGGDVDVVRVQIDYKRAPPPRCANVALGNGILAMARCWLYEIMDEVMEDNGVEALAYCDTDSVIWKGRAPRAHRIHDVRLGALAGEFEDDSKIRAFVTLSPKVYAFDEETEDGGTQEFLKAKGINSGHNWAAAMGYQELAPRYMLRRDQQGLLHLAGEDFDPQSDETPRPTRETYDALPDDLRREGISFQIIKEIVMHGGYTLTVNPQMMKGADKSVVHRLVERLFRDVFDKRKVIESDLYLTEPWSNIDSPDSAQRQGLAE